MAATQTRTRKATSTTKATKAAKRVMFNSDSADHWHTIPSKGQLFALAIASFNGAKIDGAAFGSREVAKAAVAKAKEDGFLPAGS